MKKFVFTFVMMLSSLVAKADDVMLTKCGGAEESWPYGSYTAGTLEAATQFTAEELKDYVGGRITKIRFFAAWTYYYDWFDLWVKNNYDDELRLAEVRTTDITADLFKWHYYELPTPVEITGEPIALGATFNCTDMTFPLACCILDTPGGLYMKQPDGEWQDFSTYYNLCIEAVVEGIDLSETTVELKSISLPSHCYALGETSQATVSLLNTGSDIESITLAATCGGNTVEKTFTEPIAHSAYYTATLGFTAPDKVTPNCELNVAVTAINGQPYEGGGQTITFGAYENNCERTVLVEEATNAGNGYCVRGVVAMDYMHERYPDSFIGIAIHSNSDPMGIRSYLSGDLGIEEVPGCTVDRWPLYRSSSVSADFYEYYYAAERARGTYADFELEARIDEDSNIVGTTSATFGFDNDQAKLRMVYVVLEDGVTGYTMANSYSGGMNGEMDGFEWLPATIDFLPFDRVARAIYPSQFGEDGNLPASFAKGELCRHEFSYPVPQNVQDFANLSLVAIMLDGPSGEVVQAHKVQLEVPDAVEGVKASDGRETWHSINGSALPGRPAQPGVYICNGKKTVTR